MYKRQILENIANSVKSNTAWLGVVDSAQSKPAKLDRFRSGGAAFGTVSADELLAMARTYLSPDRALLVQSLYEAAGTGTALAARQSPVAANAAPQ